MFKSSSTSLILLGILAVVVGIVAIAWPGVTILALVILFAVYAFMDAGVGAVTLALLFGLYALIYGFSQITVGIQVRHLGSNVKSLSQLRDAA
jgi:uncharacterized membrane protein HdeD (DUF308 family)